MDVNSPDTPENGSGAPDAGAPDLPPKITDVFNLLEAAPEPAPPVAAEPAAEAAPPKMVFSAPAAQRSRKSLWIAVGAVCALVVLTVAGLMIARAAKARPAATGPQAAAAAQPGAAAATASKPLKLRISIPLPPEADVSAAVVPPSAAELLRQLHRILGTDAEAGKTGLKPLIGIASLSVLDLRFGLDNEDLKTLDAAQSALLMQYQELFRQLGSQLGTNGSQQTDIENLQAARDRFSASTGAAAGN